MGGGSCEVVVNKKKIFGGKSSLASGWTTKKVFAAREGPGDKGRVASSPNVGEEALPIPRHRLGTEGVQSDSQSVYPQNRSLEPGTFCKSLLTLYNVLYLSFMPQGSVFHVPT